VSLSLGSRDDEIAAIAVDAEGKIVVVGTTASTVGSGSNVFVARLLSDGRLDAEFGQEADGTPDGVVNLSFGEGDDFGRAVAIESDGKIVVIGDRVNGSSSDIVLARLLAK
jgi:predicted RecA/RadA family phage recombinase